MNKSLETIVDKAVYDAVSSRMPSLIVSIRNLIAMGQTPTDIEREMIRRFGKGQISRDARHIAEHVARL